MGSLILCHRQKAKQPYEIARVHVRVYTIEELCYYICNNLYLIDYTLMNRRLCRWFETELGLLELAKKLREALDENCSLEQFVMMILKESCIYLPADLNRIQGILEHLQSQKEVERAKHKADSLWEGGEYEASILVYQTIVDGEWDDSLDKSFYGKVYACLGAAYGRLFLYKEAIRMYEEACRLCEEPEFLKAYLYCCKRGRSEAEYVKMLSGNPAFLSLDSVLKEELKQISVESEPVCTQEQLTHWKKDYKKVDNHSEAC